MTVDIDQPKTSPLAFTVATYNICHGHYAAFDWMRIAEAVRGADLVGVQEVDVGTRRSHGVDEVAALRAALSLPHAFFIPAMEYDGGRYGTAILSRYPLSHTAVHSLAAPGCEPRAYGEAVVTFPDGRLLCFVNTHLSYESSELRYSQMATLAAHLANVRAAYGTAILTGDFNTEDPSTFAPLTAKGLSLVNCAERRLPTFRLTRSAIDNIAYDPTSLVSLAVTMPDSDASDHDPLMARFAWR